MATEAAVEDAAAGAEAGVTLAWPGYGLMFFLQAGMLQHLQTHYDLSSCTLAGSSAGALLCVLARCDVAPSAAIDAAHRLCERHGTFRRPLGLLGVWGALVREWLDELLPADAAQRCSQQHGSGGVRIVLTTVWPRLAQDTLSEFASRAELIDACLASCHVPVLMDCRLTTRHQGRSCVDGSLMHFLSGRCAALQPPSQHARVLMFSPWPALRGSSSGSGSSVWGLLRGLLRCVALVGKQGAEELLRLGAEHARALEAAGGMALLQPYRRRPAASPPPQLQLQNVPSAVGAGASTPHQQQELGQEQLAGVSPSSSAASLDAVVLITGPSSSGGGAGKVLEQQQQPGVGAPGQA